ncbi:hypothetical protein CL621_02395 [archaeon]|nr:hypothetical protein [archaeon]|tara:strand:+ start:3173 stop:3586 length:414 start_codon:yes stop_codon:yes gene_type:complete
MALEKIVSFAKVNFDSLIAYTISTGLVGLTLKDGFQTEDLKFLGVQLFIAGYGALIQKQHQNEYIFIGDVIKKDGFGVVIGNKKDRRLAKIYAKENNLMDQYNLELEKLKAYEVRRDEKLKAYGIRIDKTKSKLKSS